MIWCTVQACLSSNGMSYSSSGQHAQQLLHHAGMRRYARACTQALLAIIENQFYDMHPGKVLCSDGIQDLPRYIEGQKQAIWQCNL